MQLVNCLKNFIIKNLSNAFIFSFEKNTSNNFLLDKKRVKGLCRKCDHTQTFHIVK